jgi:putative Mn2+ efflux pump MntP
MAGMRYVTSLVLMISWALWIGGIVAVLVGVTAIFGEFPGEQRATAGRAAAAVFRNFSFYELIVAAVALVTAVALRLMRPGYSRTSLFILLALAALMAAISAGIVTPRIDTLRLEGQSHSDAFKKLHGISMMLFSGRALLLLAGGFLLPVAMLRNTDRSSSGMGDVEKL